MLCVCVVRHCYRSLVIAVSAINQVPHCLGECERTSERRKQSSCWGSPVSVFLLLAMKGTARMRLNTPFARNCSVRCRAARRLGRCTLPAECAVVDSDAHSCLRSVSDSSWTRSFPLFCCDDRTARIGKTNCPTLPTGMPADGMIRAVAPFAQIVPGGSVRHRP